MKHPPQEPNVVPVKIVAAAILGVIASIAIGVISMKVIEHYRSRGLAGDPRAAAEQPSAVPGEVNAIETAPFVLEAQGTESNELAEHVLESYGWVDREHQIARIPITIAFDVYLARRPAPVARSQP